MIGQTIRQFRIDALAGEGGMGVVYRAFDTRLKRNVALKVLRAELAGSEVRQRFYREAEAAARLSHPNIATVYDIIDHNDQLVIVTEWVDGTTLEGVTFLARDNWKDALHIFAQVADGLDAAHAAGVIHRDIKPANIMLSASGHVKICDFGVARLTDTTTTQGSLVGTPRRISPEQWRGARADHRSDIFSFGVLAYEILTGRTPFGADELESIGYQIVHEEPTAPSVLNRNLPRGADEAIAAALAKEPALRPSSAREFVSTLSAALAIQRSDTTPVDSPIKRRNKLWIILGLSAVVIAVLLLLVPWPGGINRSTLAAETVENLQSANPERLPRLIVLPTTIRDDRAAGSASGFRSYLIRVLRDQSGFAVVDPPSAIPATATPDWKQIGIRSGADLALSISLREEHGQYGSEVELTALETGTTIWKKTIQGSATGGMSAFALRIVRELVAAVGWKPLGTSAFQRQTALYSPAVEKWLERGHRAMELRDYALAAEMYDSALDASHGDLVLHYWIGVALAAQGHLEGAIRSLRLAASDAPGSSLFLWDTTITPPRTSCGMCFRIESEGIISVIYQDSIADRFHVNCVDALSHIVHYSALACDQGFPVVDLPESHGRQGNTWASALCGSDSNEIALRITDWDGNTLGRARKVPLPVAEETSWYGRTLAVAYRRASDHGMPRMDSVVFLDDRGTYIGTLHGPIFLNLLQVENGFVCSSDGTKVFFHTLAPWTCVDSIDCETGLSSITTRKGTFLLSGIDGHIAAYNTRRKDPIQSISLPTETQRWTIFQDDNSNHVVLTSGNNLCILARDDTLSVFDVRFRADYPRSFAILIENDSLWVFMGDRSALVLDLDKGHILGEFKTGPAFGEEQPGEFKSLRRGILHANGQSITLYSRETMKPRWRRTIGGTQTRVQMTTQDAVYLRSGVGQFLWLDGATGKLVGHFESDWGDGLDDFGTHDRVFIRRRSIGTWEREFRFAELAQEINVPPVDRGMILEALGSSLYQTGDYRGAVGAFQQSLSSCSGSSLKAYAGLEDAYRKLGLWDSAFWAASEASWWGELQATPQNDAEEFLSQHFRGSVVHRIPGGFQELRLSSTARGLLYGYRLQSENTLVRGLEGARACILDSIGDAFDARTFESESTLPYSVVLASREPDAFVRDDTTRISWLSLWNLETCNRLWSVVAQRRSTNRSVVHPRVIFPDSTRLILITSDPPRAWDDSTSQEDPASITDSITILVLGARHGDTLAFHRLYGSIPLTWWSSSYAGSRVLHTYALGGFASNGDILAASINDSIIAYDVLSGVRIWAVEAPRSWSQERLSPWEFLDLRTDSVLAVYSDSAFVGLSLFDGQTLWSLPTLEDHDHVFIDDDHVAWCSRDTVLIATLGSGGHQLRPPTQRWLVPGFQEGRGIRQAGDNLIIVDRDFISTQCDLKLLNTKIGAIIGRLPFATRLMEFAVKDSAFYGVLPNGLVFSAPIDRLLFPN